jgi:DNA-directed RNA polymerase subunit N (RpoN/RPB10)
MQNSFGYLIRVKIKEFNELGGDIEKYCCIKMLLPMEENS